MRRPRILVAAGLVLALTPTWGAAVYQARAAGGNGIAQSDFAAMTPANATLFTAVQATAADQNPNLTALEHAVLSKVNLGALMGGQTGGTNTRLFGMVSQLMAGLNGVFNGEAAVSMLPVTTATAVGGKIVPQFHILVEAGLRPGVGAAALQGALMLQGLSGSTTSTHDGVAISSLNVASLVRTAGAGVNLSAPELSRLQAINLQIAVVKDTAIVSGDLPTIDAAIDAATGSASTLAANPDFQTTLAALPSGRVATMFFHTDLTADQQLAAALMPRKAPGQTLVGTLSQAFSVSAETNGLLVTAGPRVATGLLAETPNLVPTSGATAGILPAGTLLYAALTNPGVLVQYAQLQAANLRQHLGATGPAVDPIKVIDRLLGLDLNQDVLSWMTGEASVALLPTGSASAKTAAGRRLSLVFTLKIDNQALVDSKLHQILSAFQALTDNPTTLQLVPTTGAGGVVQQVLAATPDGVGYAFVNGYLVIATALPADVAALQAAAPGATLASDPQFQAAIQAAGGASAGTVMYANLTALRQTFEQLAAARGANLTRYDATMQPWLSAFTSLAVVTRPGAAGGGTLFLGIAS
ncbi:MAG TPA: DUF3352 domain-containing protein [Chloroflexota bacterium]|nr:DUF3352 domain-containing protein [Chloroflexota bacterium]